MVRRKGSDTRSRGEEEEISEEEIRRVIGKLKDGKAAGIDGIPE